MSQVNVVESNHYYAHKLQAIGHAVLVPLVYYSY